MQLRELASTAAIVIAAFASVGALKLATDASGAGATAAPASPTAVTVSSSPPRPSVSPTSVPKALAVAPLTGLPFTGAPPRAVAIMVDNSADAVPQSGLDRADIVIEALVEGGITRFMAIYQSQEATVEPVRSARTPFLHWALEYDALFAHVGRAETPGAADSGAQIALWHIADLDFEGGPNPASNAFSRDPGRAAPHNVVTRTGDLRAAAIGRDYRPAQPATPWLFAGAPGGDSRGQPATRIDLRFGTLSSFAVSWQWEAVRGVYLRSQAGRAHSDAVTGRQLEAANVIVLHAPATIADANGHVLIDLVGEGKAEILTSGRHIQATWRKPSSNGRTRFYGENGAEVVLTAGATWIEVVDTSGGAIIR